MQRKEVRVLGISGFWHDSAAALIIDGKVVAAAQEERFTRMKHDQSFPVNAIKYCLEQALISVDDLDAVTIYEKQADLFQRVLFTFTHYFPKGFRLYYRSMPLLLVDRLFYRFRLLHKLRKVQKFRKPKFKLLSTEHHLSHAAGAFYPSMFKEAAILTIDGAGDWSTLYICHGEGKQIKILKELKFPHSLGFLYSAFTEFLGFKVNNGEYKLMGLAPYGNEGSENVKQAIKIIKSILIDIAEDGSIWLNQDYFRYSISATGQVIHQKHWESIFGIIQRSPNAKIEQKHCDIALAIQTVTEEIVLKLATEAKRLTKSQNLCLSGGVALNCVANGKIRESGIFKHIYIQPAAGDDGGAIGAALATHFLYFDQKRNWTQKMSGELGPYLGPEYSESAIRDLINKYQIAFRYFKLESELCRAVAELISEGYVVGWFQGRMEFGPRALGNRSILGNPLVQDMHQKINQKIKFREAFRPFAPTILEEDVMEYFDEKIKSPYMLLVTKVKQECRYDLPADYQKLTWNEKLKAKRSPIQAVTHVNFSTRVQTLNSTQNPRFYRLIKEFKHITGHGVLINTSFNVRGEPIVCTPLDAYRCYIKTEMDYLVLGNYLIVKHPDQLLKLKI